MSKTDKTKPIDVRLLESGAVLDEEYLERFGRKTFDHIPADFKWTNQERNGGAGYIRWAKRYRSKRNRRRDVPWQKMTGYGRGDENYCFW